MASTRTTKIPVPSVTEIEYPESDGMPLGETGVHVDVTTLGLLDVIRRHFKGNPNVAVQSNMFIYYVDGDPKRVVCPDLFVALNVPSRIERRTFKVWEEGRVPDTVIEVTSKKTRREDQKQKFGLYRDVLRVREYFLFDPFEEYLKPSLQGYRLAGDQYEPIVAVENRLRSEVLGLHLERDGVNLRLYNPLTGSWAPTSTDLENALGISEAHWRENEAAKFEAQRAKFQAERAKFEAERAKAEAERAKAEAERAKVEVEAKNREFEAEIQRLQRELATLQSKRST